ncbi:MAG: C25 family cysteine peptidase [Caldilineaceae bacterium]
MQHRQAQGYQVTVIDVQEIYHDGWGYGYASPDAIRDFLAWAVAKWRPVAHGGGAGGRRHF